MKRQLLIILLVILILSTSVEASGKVKALPSPQKVRLDGRMESISAYLINGNNYFKIRDLAAILNKTESKFSVSYDANKNAVIISTGKSYQVESGDLKPLPVDAREGILSPQKIILNGQEVKIKAYLVSGNNFFMLRDLGDKIGFEVNYDSKSRTVLIESKKTASNFVAERVQLQAFPREGFQVRKYLYNIKFTVGNNIQATPNYDPVTGKIIVLTDEGENLDLGQLEIYVEQAKNYKKLNVDQEGVLSYEEMERSGIDFSKAYTIGFFIRNGTELIPLLILEYTS
ncbi:MAG: hypothetical protein GX219_01315 [Tissierellia bacterium]|nr:hypothetical protein [Tissierellia bacterium]